MARLIHLLLLAAALVASQPGLAGVGELNSVRQFASTAFSVTPADIVLSDVDKPATYTRVELSGRLLGFVASTWKVAGSVGYSGKPVDVLLAISPEGQIKAAKLLEQTEPILTIGISPDDITAFVGSFQGQDVLQQAAATDGPTAIAGATVSSGVIRDGIVRTARAVLQAQSALADQGQRKLDLAGFTERTWGELTNNGSIVNRRIAVAEARTLLGEEVYEASGASDDAPFAELYVGVLSPPAIGQNLLGKQVYTALVSSAPPEAAIIFVAGNGLYSFKGTQWKKSGVFDRIELLQGDKTIKLTSNGYHAIDDLKP
jgi:NosR/NirI family nitrite reductase transcriptional regulator